VSSCASCPLVGPSSGTVMGGGCMERWLARCWLKRPLCMVTDYGR
jgi:hypothetical protein